MSVELEWIERERTVTYEYMWRDHITGWHYEADAPRDSCDVMVMRRHITVESGVVLGAHPDLGETTWAAGQLATTRVELPAEIGAWQPVETRGTA